MHEDGDREDMDESELAEALSMAKGQNVCILQGSLQCYLCLRICLKRKKCSGVHKHWRKRHGGGSREGHGGGGDKGRSDNAGTKKVRPHTSRPYLSYLSYHSFHFCLSTSTWMTACVSQRCCGSNAR
eukprot:SAG31_NODE_3870_length_3798_cov_2.788862_3_plen_127_part_00